MSVLDMFSNSPILGSFIIVTIGYVIYLFFTPEEEEEKEVKTIIQEKIVVDESKNEELNKEIEELNNEIQHLNNSMKDKELEIHRLEGLFYEQKEELEVYKNVETVDISSFQEEIDDLKNQLEERNKDIITVWT